MIAISSQPPSIATQTLLKQFFGECRSREVRSIMEFTEDEIVLPLDGGPREGERFRYETQPFSKLLHEQIVQQQWSEYMITGPSQSGKTLLCFVVLVAWVVAELRKNVVLGVPDMNMADDKWRIDILPVFEASPFLRELLPREGPGSRGGKVKNTIELANGSIIKFMSPSGDDSNKAGFTARHIIVTEAARFSEASETSVEADPLRQLKARQRSVSRFDENRKMTVDRQMFVEGTVTLEEELPWRAKSSSSESQIVCPCPHCGDYVCPEREHLSGWDEAKSELEAAEVVFWVCPSCGEEITDEQRVSMNQANLLLHAGQTVEKGKIVGEPPRTMRLWFRWNAFNNLFASTADLAVEEWNCHQHDENTPERINAEKDLCQSIWCIPYQPPVLQNVALDRHAVARRQERYPVNIAPEDTEFITVGVDVGLYRCWYFGMAFRSNFGLHSPFFGSFDTSLSGSSKKTPEIEAHAIRSCLHEMAAQLMDGISQEGETDRVIPSLVLVDSAYHPDAVFSSVESLNDHYEDKFMALLGRGEGDYRKAAKYVHPTSTSKTVREIDEHGRWYVQYEAGRGAWRLWVDSDAAKLEVQDCLRVQEGKEGSLTLPMAPKKELSMVSRHLASELRVTELDPLKGLVTKWKKTGQNHLLDCAAYALTAGRYLGWTPAFRAEAENLPNELAEPTGPAEPKKQGWFSSKIG